MFLTLGSVNLIKGRHIGVPSLMILAKVTVTYISAEWMYLQFKYVKKLSIANEDHKT